MSETHEPSAAERLLTCAEVADIMRVKTRAVQHWAKQGILQAVKLPGRQRARGYRTYPGDEPRRFAG